MITSFIESLEPHVILLYLLHALISLVLAVILTALTRKRFVMGTDFILAKDSARLKAIENRSRIFKLLFKVALHKNNRITSVFFMFLFNFSMPFVGYFFSLWITYYINTVKYEKKVTSTNILNLDEFGMSFLKIERIFGEGSMNDLMVNEYAPKSKKLKALSSLANHMSPQNLRVIRQTLTSTDDEIRMFGYAILNKAEKSLSIKINKQLGVLNAKHDENSEEHEDKEEIEKRRADAANELAYLYWEMVYIELSHESLKDNFLIEVVNYIKIAKDYYIPKKKRTEKNIDEHSEKIKLLEEEKSGAKSKKTKKENLENEKKIEFLLYDLQEEKNSLEKLNEVCIKLYVLMGRVYMSKKEYENAKMEFTIAQELNETKASFILPYLAEINFLTANYKVVNAILKGADNLELNATLNPVIEQWRVSS